MVNKEAPAPWNGAAVRAWLESRILAARADQVAAERRGREGQDDCDIAAAEELVCTALKRSNAADDQNALLAELKALLDRDDYVWRGVYNDARFERHVRACLRKLIRMTKTNAGFGRTTRYQ